MFEKQITSILNNIDESKNLNLTNKMLLQQFEKILEEEIKKSDNPSKTMTQIKDHLNQIDLFLRQTNSFDNEASKKKFQKLIQQLFNLNLVHNIDINLSGINELHLNYHIGDLIILPTNSQTASLYDWMSRDINKLHSTIEKVGNVIKLTQGPRKHVGIFKNKIILFLPKTYDGFITIRSESDKVCVANLQSNCMVDITSITGNVSLISLHVERLQADLTSGNIMLNGCLAEDIHINTHSGNISAYHIKDLNSDTETIFTSTSGNVNLNNFFTHHLVIETKSGHIHTQNLNTATCNLNTISGTIKAATINSNGTIKSNTGKIKLSLTNQFNGQLSIKTNLSPIKVNLEKKFPLKFNVKGNLGAITLPLDAIIFDNNEYNQIKGYLIQENTQSSVLLESMHGSIDMSVKNKP